MTFYIGRKRALDPQIHVRSTRFSGNTYRPCNVTPNLEFTEVRNLLTSTAFDGNSQKSDFIF